MRTTQIGTISSPLRSVDTTSMQDKTPLKTNNSETDDGQSVVTDVIKSEDGSNRIVHKVCDKNLVAIVACSSAMSLAFGLVSGFTLGSAYLGLKVGSTILGMSTIGAMAVAIKNYVSNDQKPTGTPFPAEQAMLSKV